MIELPKRVKKFAFGMFGANDELVAAAYSDDVVRAQRDAQAKAQAYGGVTYMTPIPPETEYD